MIRKWQVPAAYSQVPAATTGVYDSQMGYGMYPYYAYPASGVVDATAAQPAAGSTAKAQGGTNSGGSNSNNNNNKYS